MVMTRSHNSPQTVQLESYCADQGGPAMLQQMCKRPSVCGSEALRTVDAALAWSCPLQVLNEQDVRAMFGQVQGEVPGSPQC